MSVTSIFKKTKIPTNHYRHQPQKESSDGCAIILIVFSYIKYLFILTRMQCLNAWDMPEKMTIHGGAIVDQTLAR